MPGLLPAWLADASDDCVGWFTLPSFAFHIHNGPRGTARRVVRHRRGRFAYAIRAQRAPPVAPLPPSPRLRTRRWAGGRRILVCRPVGRCPRRLRFVGYFVRAALQGGSTRSAVSIAGVSPITRCHSRRSTKVGAFRDWKEDDELCEIFLPVPAGTLKADLVVVVTSRNHPCAAREAAEDASVCRSTGWASAG